MPFTKILSLVAIFVGEKEKGGGGGGEKWESS